MQFFKARDKNQNVPAVLKDALTSYAHCNNIRCYTLVISASVQYLTWFKKYRMPKNNCTIFMNSSQKYQVIRLLVNLLKNYSIQSYSMHHPFQEDYRNVLKSLHTHSFHFFPEQWQSSKSLLILTWHSSHAEISSHVSLSYFQQPRNRKNIYCRSPKVDTMQM